VRAGISTYFLGVNRNKRSVALDLRDAGDLALAQELARRADIVVENFKPGGLARFGLDYDSVAASNTGVVYASISGFGSGPKGRPLPGYDLMVQAMSGLMSLTGAPDGEPYRAGNSVFDVMAGLHATIGVLAALNRRHTTGRGQHVEVNLLSSALSGLVNQTSAYVAGGSYPAADCNPVELTIRESFRKVVDTLGGIDVPVNCQVTEYKLKDPTLDERIVDNYELFTQPVGLTHMDGARLLNAVVASGIPAREFAAGFDSVWIDFSKGLGAPVGAALAGSQEFILEAWQWKQRLGGAMRQAGIIAAAGVFALRHHVGRLAVDHENAKLLARGLAELRGITLNPDEVDTNIVILDISEMGRTARDLADELLTNGLRMSVVNPTRLRAVTHLDISRQDVEEALQIVRRITEK
jgi:hypothetical protein